MAIIQFSVAPLGTGQTSLSSYVADIHRVLAEEGIEAQLTPMGTIIEGPLETLLGVIAKVHELPFANGADRVLTIIQIDDRRDKPASAAAKVASVREKLGRA